MLFITNNVFDDCLHLIKVISDGTIKTIKRSNIGSNINPKPIGPPEFFNTSNRIGMLTNIFATINKTAIVK